MDNNNQTILFGDIPLTAQLSVVKLAPIATTASVNDLSDFPTIPTNDDIVDIVDEHMRSTLAKVAFDGRYSSLTERPSSSIIIRPPQLSGDSTTGNYQTLELRIKALEQQNTQLDANINGVIDSTLTAEITRTGQLSDAVGYAQLDERIDSKADVSYVDSAVQNSIDEMKQNYPTQSSAGIVGISHQYYETSESIQLPLEIDSTYNGYVTMPKVQIPGIPTASASSIGGVKLGYQQKDGTDFPAEADENGDVFVNISLASDSKYGLVKLGATSKDNKVSVEADGDNRLYVDISKNADALEKSIIAKINEIVAAKVKEQSKDPVVFGPTIEVVQSAQQLNKTVSVLYRKEHPNGIVEYSMRYKPIKDIVDVDTPLMNVIVFPDALEKDSIILDTQLMTTLDQKPATAATDMKLQQYSLNNVACLLDVDANAYSSNEVKDKQRDIAVVVHAIGKKTNDIQMLDDSADNVYHMPLMSEHPSMFNYNTATTFFAAKLCNLKQDYFSMPNGVLGINATGIVAIGNKTDDADFRLGVLTLDISDAAQRRLATELDKLKSGSSATLQTVLDAASIDNVEKFLHNAVGSDTMPMKLKANSNLQTNVLVPVTLITQETLIPNISIYLVAFSTNGSKFIMSNISDIQLFIQQMSI